MKFYKFRSVIAMYLVKFIIWLFAVEIPPVVSVAAIIKKDKKVLFIKFSYLDGYGLPGGLVKSNENVEQALKREVFEETGLKVFKTKFFNSYSTNNKGVGKLALVYEVYVKGSLKSSDEGIPVWFDPDNIKNKFAYKDNELAINDYMKNG